MPTGDLPRSMMCLVDRRLCSAVSPGTRVTAVGILSIFQGKEGEALADRHALCCVPGMGRVVHAEWQLLLWPSYAAHLPTWARRARAAAVVPGLCCLCTWAADTCAQLCCVHNITSKANPLPYSHCSASLPCRRQLARQGWRGGHPPALPACHWIPGVAAQLAVSGLAQLPRWPV